MSYNVIFTQGTATFTVPAGEKVAVQAYSPASVFQEVGYPNFPETQDLLQVVENTTYVSGAFTNATIVTIQAGASGALYAVGVAPVITDDGNWQLQGGSGKYSRRRFDDCHGSGSADRHHYCNADHCS